MNVEIDILGEIWLTTKEYISPKDRQAAADHVLNVVADHNITERELKAFGATDSYLKRSLKEYLGEDEVKDIDYDDEDDEDNDY
jgi:hypothetical protein